MANSDGMIMICVIFNIVLHCDFVLQYMKKTWKLFTGGGGVGGGGGGGGGVCWGRGWVTLSLLHTNT